MAEIEKEREETENAIFEKLKEIWQIYRKYNPDGWYLSLFVADKGNRTFYSINNSIWDTDKNKPVDCMKVVTADGKTLKEPD